MSPGLPRQRRHAAAARLRVRATTRRTPNTAFADITANPVTLSTWAAPITNDAVPLQFQQAIGANEALKAGVRQDADVHALDDQP